MFSLRHSIRHDLKLRRQASRYGERIHPLRLPRPRKLFTILPLSFWINLRSLKS